jgi:hypothetical protein
VVYQLVISAVAGALLGGGNNDSNGNSSGLNLKSIIYIILAFIFLLLLFQIFLSLTDQNALDLIGADDWLIVRGVRNYFDYATSVIDLYAGIGTAIAGFGAGLFNRRS